MLAYSMLGEPGEIKRNNWSRVLQKFCVALGGPEFFSVPSRMNKLVERAAHILASATSPMGGAASLSSGHTTARLGSFLQQISFALHAAHPALFVAAFARLTPLLQVRL